MQNMLNGVPTWWKKRRNESWKLQSYRLRKTG